MSLIIENVKKMLFIVIGIEVYFQRVNMKSSLGDSTIKRNLAHSRYSEKMNLHSAINHQT